MKSLETIEPLNARGRKNEVSAEEWALYRIEMTRRELHKLLAAVELCSDYAKELAAILESTINDVVILAERAEEAEAEEEEGE